MGIDLWKFRGETGDNRIRSFALAILLGIAAIGLTVTTAQAAIVTLPTGLNPGEVIPLPRTH